MPHPLIQLAPASPRSAPPQRASDAFRSSSIRR
jgi:hypothetical protein